MILLAIEFYKCCLKVFTYACEYQLQFTHDLLSEYFPSILCNKDQVYVHCKYACSSMPQIIDFFIRPLAETRPLRAGYFQKQCWAEYETRPQLNPRP